jgi:hypothetical protein
LSTTKQEGSNAEPSQAVATGIGIVSTVIDAGLDAAKRTGEIIPVPSKTGNGTIDLVEKANDFGKAGDVLGKTLKSIGVVTAVYDAYGAISDAINKGGTGNYIKAGFKVGMAALEIFGRVNPVMGIALGILDMTGVTDEIFKKFD